MWLQRLVDVHCTQFMFDDFEVFLRYFKISNVVHNGM